MKAANQEDSTTTLVPPPWRLTGRGYVLVLAPIAGRNRDLGDGRRLHPVRILGGFGLLLAVDYRSSDVGPYREILYIPGYASVHVAAAHGFGSARAPRVLRGHSITQIYVTTQSSRESGIANWGIPKRVGRITWESPTPRGRMIRLSSEEGVPLLEIQIASQRKGGRPDSNTRALPVSSRYLPHTLLQVAQSVAYVTTIEAIGRASLARRVHLRSLAPQTEEMASRRVIACFRVPTIHLRFPEAETFPLGRQAAR